jgi:hypothetical protein
MEIAQQRKESLREKSINNPLVLLSADSRAILESSAKPHKPSTTSPSDGLSQASGSCALSKGSASARTNTSLDSLEDWPVFAVGTKLLNDKGSKAEFNTVLVRVPAAEGSRVLVRILSRNRLVTSPVTGSMSNFYKSTKEAFNLQPFEEVTEVIEGLAWLTLKRPSSSSRGELDLPDGALVAVCQPVQPSPSLGLPSLNKAGPPVRKIDFFYIFFCVFQTFRGLCHEN